MSAQDTVRQGTKIVQLPIDPRYENATVDTGVLGLSIFLVSLTVLFLASMTGYLIVRLRAEEWIPEGMPSLPNSMWLSTMIILISSITIHWAYKSARHGKQSGIRYGMLSTTLLGTLFLIVQIFNWNQLMRLDMPMNANLYAFTFYMLTGLHALHVIGGLIPMLITTVKSFKNVYSSHNYSGILYCWMYWHFLDAIWLAMFALLLIFS